MKNKELKNKIIDLFIFLIFYLISYVASYFIANLIDSIILKLFIFDVIATTLIYIFSLFIKNSSLYDAYWSLTPFVMLTYLFVVNFDILNVYHYIIFAVFSFWSFRLTINWIITFQNRKWIDWRYVQLKENNNPFVWQIINYFGIMMMPTILVFVGFIPLIFVFSNAYTNYFSIIGIVIILIGTLLEFFADRQMHRFLKSKQKGDVINVGLWKYSRHPNYLGEILVWIGVYFCLFPSIMEKWYFFVGALLMILLFVFVSIPLAEKRQLSRRKQYANYKKTTSMLLLLPNKNTNKTNIEK